MLAELCYYVNINVMYINKSTLWCYHKHISDMNGNMLTE